MRAQLLLAVLLGCGPPPCALPTPEPVDRPNVLLIAIDDVGIDQVGAWGVGADPVATPTLDCLCDAGVRFDRVYASPYCSPARAALLTGVHPRRDGLGRYLDGNDTWEIPPARTTLAEALIGYDAAFLGKWHVGSEAGPSGLDHPGVQGFAHFAGTVGNLRQGDPLDVTADYTRWEQIENGVPSLRTGYVTTATIDDAVERVAIMPEPWILVVSLHAAHVPLHAPPRRLLDAPLPDDASEAETYRALLSAADTELGRLLRAVEADVLARTQIWALSDNGTPSHAIAAPQDPTRGKGTLFEGGVRVPMVVAGAGVGAPGSVSDALVSLVDVLPTIAVATGSPAVADLDGASFAGLLTDPGGDHAETLYADLTAPNGAVGRAIRSEDTKLVRRADGTETWYALGEGLDEVELGPEAADPALREAMDEAIAAFREGLSLR